MYYISNAGSNLYYHPINFSPLLTNALPRYLPARLFTNPAIRHENRNQS